MLLGVLPLTFSLSGERGQAAVEGNHGPTENGACVVWQWVGYHPQVYLLRVLSPGCQTEGNFTGSKLLGSRRGVERNVLL